MLRCREISKLVSESMERDLPLSQRMQLRMHLMMCRLCAGFARQVRLLRQAVHEHPERLGPDQTDQGAKLPDEARQRIKAALHNGDG